MDQNDDRDRAKAGLFVWLSLLGVFLAAVAVTLVITSGDDGNESEFPDLGDLTAADPDVPNTNEAAPTFALPTLEGDLFDLAAHVAVGDKPVVLNLWASWCPPCRAEMPAINVASQRHPEVQFVGVAVNDDPDKAAEFAAEIDVSYTIAIDDGTVEDAYPVLGLPGTFFINSDGTIAKRHFGVVTVDSLDDDIADLFGD